MSGTINSKPNLPTELFPASWVVRNSGAEGCKIIVDILAILWILAERLLYEATQDYKGEKPVRLPPLPDDMSKLWDQLNIPTLFAQRFGWFAEMQEDGSILLTPITIEPEDLEP